jgi:4-amino-4-deoxy-L-arabinose transferase-like glycosyltransferase
MSSGVAAVRSDRVPARSAAAQLRASIARIPRAGLVCMAVAVLNAAAWSFVTVPFHIPDESWHYSYVEYVAAHGRPPAQTTPPQLSPSVQAVVMDLDLPQVIEAPENGTVWTGTERQRLVRDLAHIRSRAGTGGSYADVPEPPLYYALEAVPFSVASGGSVLDRLQLMRLFSALLAGVTVLGTFLFLREALPAHPWTWSVGALGVAFLPLFALVGGGVSPDNLLFAISAWVFLLFARIFRRGLTTRRTVAMGALLGIGFITKMNFVGLMPGIALGLLVAAVWEQRSLRPQAFRLPLLALAVAAVPALAITALDILAWGRPAFGTGIYSTSRAHASLTQALTYMWEFYLPTLPGMRQLTAWSFAPRDAWFRNLVGGFGWFETHFAPWVYDVALIPALVVLTLCVATLIRHRTAIYGRLAELSVYAMLAGGLLLLIAASSYNLYARRLGGAAEARYLLPLVPLYGGLLALAARGAGRRWMPLVGTMIVMLAIAHNAFGLLLEISRYYA